MRLHGLQPLAGFAGFAAETQVATSVPAQTGAGGDAGPAASDDSALFFDGGASEMQPGQPSVQELLDGVCEFAAEAGGEFEEHCVLLEADDMDM